MHPAAAPAHRFLPPEFQHPVRADAQPGLRFEPEDAALRRLADERRGLRQVPRVEAARTLRAAFATLSNGRLTYFVFAIRYGYPWSVSWTSNMSQWRTALLRTKEAMAPQCNGDGWCPPLLVNAWCAASHLSS